MKVKLTVLESKCRCGYLKKGDQYIVEDLCPPICHELWHRVYPYIFALQNGAILDYELDKAKVFRVTCPDESRVSIEGKIMEEEE